MPTTSVADAYALVESLPPGVWAAISMDHNTILAFGTDAEAVMQEAIQKGEPHPLIMKVPEHASAMFV